MWSLPEILVQNNPELRSPETKETKAAKALIRRKNLIKAALAKEERRLTREGVEIIYV